MGLSSIQLEAFVAVTQTLNFTKASAKLYVTQSALSQRILNLEQELQTTLFIRNRDGLKLTAAGMELIRYCQSKNLLEAELMAKLKSQDSNEIAGVIRIGAFSSVARSVILPSLSGILNNNPKLKFELITEEMDELIHALKRGKIDYMVLDHRVNRDELEQIQLGFEHNYLVGKKNRTGEEIFLDHDENDQMTFEYLKLAKKKIENINRRYLGDVYGLIDGVKNNLGIAVLPKHLINNIKGIEILNPKFILKIPVSLYFYKQPFYSVLHKKIINEIVINSQKILDQE